MVSINLIAVIAILGVGVGLVAAQSASSCLFTDELWGDVNPNLFYLCSPNTKTAVQQQCASGRGFLKNGTYYGCVPFSEWPSSCVTQVSGPPTCTGNNVNQPSVAGNPNQFYLCPSAGATAVLTSCLPGKGFVSNCAGDLGCVDWALWRNLTNCVTY